jgi:hypothetical protein
VRSTASRERGKAIRAWAKDHGILVSARGRIPAGVVEQYCRRHVNTDPGAASEF